MCSKLDQTLSLLYTHAAHDNVPDDAPNSFTTAYGRGIFAKIVGRSSIEYARWPDRSKQSGCLKDRANVAVRVKALRQLVDLWHNPINIVESIPYALLDSLSMILEGSADPAGRVLASQALVLFSGVRSGRQIIYTSKLTMNLVLDLMADPDDEVKANSYTILENVFLDAAGVAAALEERLISRLMLRGQNEENPALLVKALTALSHVVGDKMGIATLIELDASLRCVVSHTRSEDGATRAVSALCMAQISRDPEGRKVILQSNAIFKLNKLLSDDVEEARVNAARALALLAVDLRGKAEIVELGVIPTLLACLGHQGARQRFLAMFALQCLAAVAENPRGRFLLNDNRDAVDLIEKAAADDPCLDRYAKRAIASMKWTP
ncbi:Armadillo repeat-containing domain-containing protein [Plasmodiophora brassicae]